MKDKIIKCVVCILLLLGSMTTSFAQGIFNVSPDTLTWSANDLTPKEFSINCRGAWEVGVGACQGLYQFDYSSGYDWCIVTVTPLSVNTSSSDRHVAVLITRSNGATVTLHLIHQAPEPEPEPDPWLGVADDLPSGHNWIQKTTVMETDGSSYRRDVSFYDGLGYATQEVLVGASSGGAGSIYTPVVYDRMRRADAKTYLPYAVSTPSGVYDYASLTHQAAFYADPTTYDDNRPFAERVYEPFPSGRPLYFQREGKQWNESGGHRTTFSYRSNTSEVIPKYVILPGTDYAKHVGDWPAGSLFCTETTDEEGSVSRSFSDGFGKTILTEQETGVTFPSGKKEKAQTLYVYDLRDSLTLVVQPEGMVALAALPGNVSRDLSLTAGSGTNGTVTDQYCFVWKRDGRGNIVSEHVPGGGTVRMGYDKRGREVLRTDGRMDPTGGNGASMILTLHDQYDRVVSERYVTTSNSSFTTSQTILRDTVLHTMASNVVNAMFSTRATLRATVYYPFETFSYPTSGDAAFVPETGFAEQADLETVRIKGFLKSETVYPAPGVDGSIPAGAPSVTRYYHYDSRGRVIQAAERWSDGTYRRVSTKYSFTGDVLGTKETVIPSGSGATLHSLATVYTRDDRGRVISCARVLDGTNNLATVNYEYDALGSLANKREGNNSGGGTSSKLETAYAYDLHGWTTEIAVGQRSTLGVLDTLFAESLYYASALKDSPAARFDGNISETGFKHRIGSSPSYSIQTNTWSYDYDGLKRLTKANHFTGSSLSSSLTDTEQGIEYDLNGNMTALKRYNSSGLENDLSFLHTGNRMTSLTDANAIGSDAGAKAFVYDANGNLTHDGRKNLDIQWNIINLVSGAVTHDGSLTYARLSDGTLVSSQNTFGNSTTGKRYCGSFVFTTGTGVTAPLVESVTWDEGRIFRDAQTGTYQDCWFAGDHLGDVRSVVDISPNLSSPVVLEQNDYLPYGTKIANSLHAQMGTNRWRYAGKEEFPEMNLMDFGARLYDSFTARWMTVDPLAEKYFSLNPFAYCTGNPVNLIDPFGTQWYSFTNDNGDTQYVYSEGRMPDDQRKQYNNLQYVGYTIVDKNHNKYYSLFGRVYDWNDSNGKPALGQMYERIDDLLIMRKLSPERKVSMYIPGLPLGEIRNLDVNCPFLYEGLTFTTIPVGSDLIKGRKSFGGESLYLGSIYWNNKDINRPSIDTSLSAITEMPTKTRPRRVNTLRIRNGYFLIANNFIGKGNGSSTLVLLFDATNANAFMESYNNIFRGHPNNK